MKGEWIMFVGGRPEEHPDEQAVLQQVQKLLSEALREKGYHDITIKDPKGNRHEVHLDVKLQPVKY